MSWWWLLLFIPGGIVLGAVVMLFIIASNAGDIFVDTIQSLTGTKEPK